MSFPEYSDYECSGFDWLGLIPRHWRTDKFRYVFTESNEKIENEVVGEMLSVSGYRGIEIKIYDDENKRRTEEELQGYRIVRPGQLVVNTMWLNYAGLGVSNYEGHVSPAYRSYWINADVDLRFIHHLMRSSIYVQGYTQLLTGIRPNRQNRRPNPRAGAPDRAASGKTPGGDFPCGDQRARSECADEGLRGGVAWGGAGALESRKVKVVCNHPRGNCERKGLSGSENGFSSLFASGKCPSRLRGPDGIEGDSGPGV